MKATIHIIILVLSILFFGCSEKASNSTKWDKIKNSKDFASFFNFAINTDDDKFLKQSIDSLEKYMPQNEFDFLRFRMYFDHRSDSLIKTAFYLGDQSNYETKSSDRNIVFVSIDKNDSVMVCFQDSVYEDYKSLIRKLHDTTDDSFFLPRIQKIHYENREFIERILGVFIYSEMFPDSLTSKTSWERLISLTQTLFLTFNDIKDKKSQLIFNTNYSDLGSDEKMLIDKIVPIFIDIYFYGIYKDLISPPPPPPKKRIIDSLTFIDN